MKLSINPSYLCNLRCDFCYLTPEQLGDTKRLGLSVLRKRLSEVIERFGSIEHIDLYGGEISALPNDYQLELLAVIREFYAGDVNLNTNLIRISPLVHEPNVTTSVSFDGPARDRWETTLCNMALLNTSFAVLVLCSPKVLEFGAQNMIDIMRGYYQIKSVEIKPYSTNQSNQHAVDYRAFEEYVIEWMKQRDSFMFSFENRNRLVDSLYCGYNAWSDDHLYITPNGRFAVLEFDLNDNEFFLELNSLDDFKKWTRVEQQRVVNNSYCGQCEFLGRCLTEHYRHVDGVDHSCSGFYHLLKWFEAETSDW